MSLQHVTFTGDEITFDYTAGGFNISKFVENQTLIFTVHYFTDPILVGIATTFSRYPVPNKPLAASGRGESGRSWGKVDGPTG